MGKNITLKQSWGAKVQNLNHVKTSDKKYTSRENEYTLFGSKYSK